MMLKIQRYSYSTMSRALHTIEQHTFEGRGDATVRMVAADLRVARDTARVAVNRLLDRGFVERVPSERPRERFAFRAVRKS